MPNELHSKQFVVVDPMDAERNTLDTDFFETNLLTVARHLFASFSKQQSHHWMEAFHVAENAFPAPFGATIGHAIAQIINEMRMSRSTTFSYYENTDLQAGTVLTREEKYLIQSLQAVKTGNHSRASASAMLLCEGGETRGLLAALERLCLITGDVLTPRYQNMPPIRAVASLDPAQ